MSLTYFKRYRMEVDLRRPLFPLPALPTGYSVQGWDEGLLESHALAKYRAFCEEVDAFVFPALGDEEGCLKLMHEITSRGEFVGEATWLVQYQPAGRRRAEYCGTIQGIRCGTDTGSVQNVGVAPDHRGLGLGTYLIGKALRGFQEVGLHRVRLEVTARNRAAYRLYRRIGFRRVRTVYKTSVIAYA